MMMKQQKVRGIPHWNKFKDAVPDIEAMSSMFDMLGKRSEAKEFVAGMSYIIQKCPKFYIPMANSVVDVEGSLLFDDELEVKLPYPITVVLSESQVSGTPEKKETLVPTHKISIFVETPITNWDADPSDPDPSPEPDPSVQIFSAVYMPHIKKWMACPWSVVAKVVPFEGKYGFMAALSNDPATTEMANLGAPSEQMIADFTDDIKTLATMLKLLEVHDCEKVSVPFPNKLASKHAKNKKVSVDDIQEAYSYHVLSIGGEVWDSPYVGGYGEGGGVRSHLRRGHFRRRNDKLFWVRATYVNGSKAGFVEKDYNVKA
jgi:hypothetical protein